MKFRLPPDCLGISLAGQPLTIGEDRIFEADEAQADTLGSHDAVPSDETPPDAPREKRRSKR